MITLVDAEKSRSPIRAVQSNLENLAARTEGYRVPFTAQILVTVNHNLGYHPLVVVYVNDRMVGALIVRLSENSFEVRFTANVTGEVRYK